MEVSGLVSLFYPSIAYFTIVLLFILLYLLKTEIAHCRRIGSCFRPNIRTWLSWKLWSNGTISLGCGFILNYYFNCFLKGESATYLMIACQFEKSCATWMPMLCCVCVFKIHVLWIMNNSFVIFRLFSLIQFVIGWGMIWVMVKKSIVDQHHRPLSLFVWNWISTTDWM